MRKSKAAPIPPIRVGTKRITYTDEAGAYHYKCELLSLRDKDGHAVSEIDADRSHRYYADVLLPDGRRFDRVPHSGGTGAGWSRPWITSVKMS